MLSSAWQKVLKLSVAHGTVTDVRYVLVNSPESGIFDRVVCVETQPKVAVGRRDDRREAAPAESAHEGRIAVRSVAHFQKIVIAIFMRLNDELVTEINANDVTHLGCWSTQSQK